MTDIHQFLKDNNIEFECFDHPAVFTCEQAQELIPDGIPGADTKNLFLRDKKGKQHVLVTVGYDKNVDLKALSDFLDAKKLGFASAERLEKYLGVTAGAVSLLGLVNDTENAVEFYMDEDLWEKDLFRVHPLVNTASITISKEGVEKFLKATGHELNVIQVP